MNERDLSQEELIKEVRRLRRESEDLRVRREHLEEVEDRLQTVLLDLSVYQEELRRQNEDLKRTQEKLAASHRKYLTLFDRAPVGYLIFDDRFYIVEANATVAEMLGVDREELIAARLLDYAPPATRPALTAHAARVFESGRAFMEGELASAAGPLPVDMDSAVFESEDQNGPALILSAVRDIAKRKQAEAQLRESREMARQIVDLSGAGYFRMDRFGRYEQVNEAWARLHGFPSPEKAAGLHFTAVQTPADRPKAVDMVRRLLSGESIPTAEITHLRVDGGVGRHILSARPLMRHGAAAGLEGFLIDTTHQRRVEQELVRYRDHLETLVEEKTAELIRANRRLQSEIAERKVAEQQIRDHQVQLQRLASELAAAGERERRRIAVDLHDGVAQALTLSKMKLTTLAKSGRLEADAATILQETVQLLDQTLGDARSLILDLRPPVLYEVGLAAAVEELLEEIEVQHGLAVEFVDDPRPLPLNEDLRSALFRCIREVILNVVKHAQAGRLTVALTQNDRAVSIEVADDGVGFSPEIAADAERSRPFGLFAVGEQLRYLGGGLDISAAPGQGAKVTLTMPLTTGSSPA
jgi:PAS domain S-box-containing protein